MNIHGVSSKLEQPNLFLFLQMYDIIMLNEIKCSYPFSLAGYHCLRSTIILGEESRGGVAVLVKNTLWNGMYSIELCKDQIWFRLKQYPGFLFAAIYVPPRDSPFFTHECFSLINEHCQGSNDMILLMGDFNSRLGSLSDFNDEALQISYDENVDTTVSPSGRDLRRLMLVNDLKPINHMIHRGRFFHGAFTFRRRTTWISQLDWAIASPAAAQCIQHFGVIHDIRMPTDHAPIEIHLRRGQLTSSVIFARANDLGESFCPHTSTIPVIKMNNIDIPMFANRLPDTADLWQKAATSNSDELCEWTTKQLYTADINSPRTDFLQMRGWIGANERWQHILSEHDSKKLWQSINWNGSFDAKLDSNKRPSDECFCQYYENLLRSPDEIQDSIPGINVHIPILDDQLEPMEVDRAIRKLKASKAAGVDGVPPGLLKLLNDEWTLFLTYVFNRIFESGYPTCWNDAKVFNIFKKGERLLPANYRGISILNALPKLYDSILSQRLSLWYKPSQEQAGASKGRGCDEQILIVRLLIDIARKTRRELYACFIDFEKAYDKVNRSKLLQTLHRKGCGSKFLRALQASYANTKGRIGPCHFTAEAGVRQGAGTSCSLFTLFVDPIVEAVRSGGSDGWLNDTHILLLMDDTVVFATSRTAMEKKLELLQQSVVEIGMSINVGKTKFIHVPKKQPDTRPFKLGGQDVLCTDRYCYLGAWIMNASVAEQIRVQLNAKTAHTLKYTSFLAKNADAPYKVKKRVWQSALLSSIFYSASSWLTTNLRVPIQVYSASLKQLLGVRTTTCTDLCLIESGEQGAEAMIREQQTKLLKRIISRSDFRGSYLDSVFQEACRTRCPAGVLLQEKLTEIRNGQHSLTSEPWRESVQTSTSTRRLAYKRMNPQLIVCDMYERSDIPEHHRIACTRIRLSSHHLQFERGRWSRLPPEERMCPCGSIQTDYHVLLECPITRPFRQHLDVTATSLESLFESNPKIFCELCFDVIRAYDH